MCGTDSASTFSFDVRGLRVTIHGTSGTDGSKSSVQGGSDGVASGNSAGTLATSAQDLASVVGSMPAPPLLVGHSFGGLICQRYLVARSQQVDAYPQLSCIAMIASAPPSGNKDMVGRFLQQAPIRSLQVHLSDSHSHVVQTAGYWP